MERGPESVWAVQDALQPVGALESAGIFSTIFRELARQPGPKDCLMIDATHLKTAASRLQKGQPLAVSAAQKVV